MDPGVVLIACVMGLSLAMAAITLTIGYLTNPPRPARWVPNPRPGRSPYYDRGRSWTDLLCRAALVGLASMFFLIPGILLLAFVGGASSAAKPPHTHH
ncbi:hypothetical protein ACN94_17945 [Gordonia paraffinivorans]|nr:hypothetical protein [Gordonia paraffinivorans]